MRGLWLRNPKLLPKTNWAYQGPYARRYSSGFRFRVFCPHIHFMAISVLAGLEVGEAHASWQFVRKRVLFDELSRIGSVRIPTM